MVLKTYFLSEAEREIYEKAVLRQMKSSVEESVARLDDTALIEIYAIYTKEGQEFK
ncbi:hypothetical protein [Ectobacillus panaciterrae]|uniref:hypothetical protein n=1 Tax=Ectobacillus panaciterrae TaxID=363872 RepID=UPI0003F8859C|nr:hypothetical protein [Ectobacillus panaciterrae]